MGMLIEGVWQQSETWGQAPDGSFVRRDAQFRDWVTSDGRGDFPAETGRYHLYVSLACPWAHRTLIFRRLKRLETAIGLSVVDPYLGVDGWWFSDYPGAIPDTVNGSTFLRDLYVRAKPDYSGRVTVPVLWDKVAGTIVSNESSEIIRMFNSAFDAFGDAEVDLYPADLRDEIDLINETVYENVNNGVYRCGFATTQSAYEAAFDALFATLDTLESRLGAHRYLVGDRMTEADWRLFTTLVRFDPVYHGHFKCNLRRLADYPNLSNYLRDLYQVPGVAETVDMDHIKGHYYRSHRSINPTGIVPKGPETDLTASHDRSRLPAAPLRNGI